MKRRSDKPRIAVLAVLLAQAASAFAGPVSEWRYVGEFQAAVSTAGLATDGLRATGLGTNFDASSWNAGAGAAGASGGSALTLDAQVAAATADSGSAAPDQRRRALAGPVTTSNTSPVVGSPASLELTLWNFVANIRAQQVGDPFVQLQTSAANIDYTLNAVPAPVPLPSALWLFGAGLAALSALRLLRRERPRGRRSAPLAAT